MSTQRFHANTITSEALKEIVNFSPEVRASLAGYEVDIEDYTDVTRVLGTYYFEGVKTFTDGGDSHYHQFINGDKALWVASGAIDEVIFAPATLTLRDVLRDWDETYYGGMQEMLTAWGLDPELEEVDEDYAEPCQAWKENNYYPGTLGAPVDGWVWNDQGDDVQTWPNAKAAYTWIEEQEEGVYALDHGEAGRPNYVVCAA